MSGRWPDWYRQQKAQMHLRGQRRRKLGHIVFLGTCAGAVWWLCGPVPAALFVGVAVSMELYFHE